MFKVGDKIKIRHNYIEKVLHDYKEYEFLKEVINDELTIYSSYGSIEIEYYVYHYGVELILYPEEIYDASRLSKIKKILSNYEY